MKTLNIIIGILFAVALSVPVFSQENQGLTRKQIEKLEQEKQEELKQKADSVLAVLNSAKRKQERKDKNITLPTADDKNFAALLSANNIVIADFYIDGCSACVAIEPLIVDMQAKYDNKIKAVKYDGYRNKKVRKEYKVEFYPTVLIFKEGKVVANLVGGYNVLFHLEEEIVKALK